MSTFRYQCTGDSSRSFLWSETVEILPGLGGGGLSEEFKGRVFTEGRLGRKRLKSIIKSWYDVGEGWTYGQRQNEEVIR